MHKIKLSSLTNLITQKFSDFAVILAITLYERCTQDFSVVKTQGSSTSFSFSYHSAISENLFKGYFFTARVDFGVANILGIRKALEHNAMSSSVSFVRRRNVLNACEILINFLACLISYLSISARDLKPDKKTATCLLNITLIRRLLK